MRKIKALASLVLIIVIVLSFTALSQELNFEKKGEEVAESFTKLLDESVENTLFLSKIDFTDLENSEKEIAKFFEKEKKEIILIIKKRG